MSTWKKRALTAEARVAELEARLVEVEAKLGRPRKAAETEDQRLVERALEVLGMNKSELADRLGIGARNVAMLARAKLPRARREQIEAMIKACVGCP